MFSALQQTLCDRRTKRKGEPHWAHPCHTDPFREGGSGRMFRPRAYLAAVAFLAADCTSSVAFLTALAASSCRSLPAAIIISTVSIWTFLAISAKAAMFSAATSALADAKSVIALA